MRIHKEILTYRYEQKVHQLFKTIQFQSTKRVKMFLPTAELCQCFVPLTQDTHTLRVTATIAGDPRRLRTQRTNFFTLLTLLIFDKMLDLIH